MSKDVRKALMIAKGQVSSGYLPPGDPQRTANLSKFMEGAHPEVLNKDGSPKTLYHGSIEPNLKRLDPRKAVEVEGGSFLTNNPDVAHQYTYERAYGDIIGDEPLGEVHHVHVNMRNPYIHPTKPGQKIVDAIEMGRAVDHAKKHGHDGVIVKNIDDSIGQTGDMGDTYVAFHPTQIKSATGNNGQYDPNEPEMNKAEGGEILPPGHPEREANLARHMEGSKAPKELYHLSKGPIPETFDSKLAAHSNRENLSPFGFHFGTKEQAAFRGNQDDFSPYVKQGPSTGKFHVSIRKPFKTTHMGSTYVDHLADTMMDANLIKPEEYDEMRAKAFDDSEIAPELKGVLKRKGYDGLVYENEREGEGLSWVPFSGTQIKSAIGNTGTFDPSDPDITKAEGGPIAAPVGGFPGMKAMPTLSAPQNSQATQAMMAAIPRMQESGPVSNTGYAPYTPAALPQRLAAVGVQPKVVPMSAEVAALKKQFPTATMDQLSEYERAIAGGGDPSATRSLMQAYGPTSNIKELQPWSPEFKGFDYARSRPVDDFGNPVGWTAPAKAAPTTGADGVPSGWDARDWENMKNFDPGSPSDEYILNNPWTRGMDTLGGNVMPGEIGTRAAERSSTGPGIAQAQALYESNKKVEAQRQAAMAANAADNTAENYALYGGPDAPEDTGRYVAPWKSPSQAMGAAQTLGGAPLPGRQSSLLSTPNNFTLNNALQTGFSALGVTPLAPLGYLANAFLTGTNAIPQAGDTGNRALNAIAQQGRMTNWGADAVNWGWRQLGGEAMQRATGGRTQACKESRKAIMIARAMGGRIGKADGGGIDDAAPIPTPVTSGPKTVFTSGGKQYEFAVTPPDKQITSKDLAAQTTDALQQHLSLPYMQQVANSKAAANKLAPYVGREKNGAVKPFLTMNAKLEKASAGYEAGPRYDAQAPLQLEGGVGVETIGMPLAPAYEHNKFKVCPNSAICKDECLGVTSGNYAQEDWWPRQNSKNRTQAFLSEPGALAVQLHGEIQNAKQAAAMRGNRLAVRLNVLSDIDPRVHEALIKANPDVDFYDYTKMNYDPIAPNHHYTYSSTGLSQPGGVNGLTEGVENKHQNWKQMRQRLDTGSNVAMVFSHKEHLPREVYDRETDKTYRVVDGTTHDYRPLDKQAEGSDGVIIGLQNLNKTGKQDNAYKDSNGFVVHYDPQVQMVPNAKTGLPTKTPVKGPSPGVNKAGKSLPRPTFPTNYRVEIAPQGGEGRADGGAVNHGRQKIHPDYAAQQFHNYHIFNGPESAPLAKGERPAQYAYGGPVEGDRELDNSGFYNAAAEAAQGIPQAKGTPQQMMSMVQKAPGTQETMKWSGADQAFAGQPIVSKDDLVKHFQTNAPKLEEKTFTGDNVKWGSNKNLNLVIPGGENYREILLKAPPNKSPERDRMSAIENRRADIQKELMKLNDDELYRHLSTEGTANVEDFTKEKIRLLSETENLKNEYKSLVPKTQNIDYNSSHWEGHPNVVAHLRMSDRTLPQTNEKALHLEELQSDWGQAGREGFKKSPEELAAMKNDMQDAHKNYLALHGAGAPSDELKAAEDKYNAAMDKWGKASKVTTPEGPYVGNTGKWTDLGLKRALIEAARNGHDKLVWTPGDDQADRYDLSQHINELAHWRDGDLIGLSANGPGGTVFDQHYVSEKELPNVVGKELAAKILNGEGSKKSITGYPPEPNVNYISGSGLKVGGEGMKGYYDKIVPTALAKIVKSIGHTPEFGTDYIKGKPYDADLDVYKHAVTGKYHVATGDKRDDPDAKDMEAGPFNTHGEAVAHRDLLYKGLKAVPSLKITPAMRETISKGLPRKTGGFVPPARSSAVEQALKLTSKSGATLPAAVFLARQHQRRD
jgi:hypothetical protein